MLLVGVVANAVSNTEEITPKVVVEMDGAAVIRAVVILCDIINNTNPPMMDSLSLVRFFIH
jgi:hypothetical protein